MATAFVVGFVIEEQEQRRTAGLRPVEDPDVLTGRQSWSIPAWARTRRSSPGKAQRGVDITAPGPWPMTC